MGISKATLERRINDQQGVAEAVEKGRADASAVIRKRAFEMAISGNVPAMTIFWLKTREGFRENPQEIHMKIEDISNMPRQQVIELGKEAIKFLESGEED